jgi:hypothetical protein
MKVNVTKQRSRRRLRDTDGQPFTLVNSWLPQLKCLGHVYGKSMTEQPISDALRQAIVQSGLSFLRLEQETGVLRQSLMRFARGDQVLRGDAYDKLSVFFGLRLQPQGKLRRPVGGQGTMG